MSGMVSPSGVEGRSLIAHVNQHGEQMLRLVTDLLDLSRIEEGMPLQIQAVSLAALLGQQAARPSGPPVAGGCS